MAYDGGVGANNAFMGFLGYGENGPEYSSLPQGLVGSSSGSSGSSGSATIKGKESALRRLKEQSKCAGALGNVTSPEAMRRLRNVSIDQNADLKITAPIITGNNYEGLFTGGVSPGDGTIRFDGNIADPTHCFVGNINGQDVFENLGKNWGSTNNDTFWSIVLLHELGHVLGGLVTDTNDQKKSEQNTDRVLKDCFPDLKR